MYILFINADCSFSWFICSSAVVCWLLLLFTGFHFCLLSVIHSKWGGICFFFFSFFEICVRAYQMITNQFKILFYFYGKGLERKRCKLVASERTVICVENEWGMVLRRIRLEEWHDYYLAKLQYPMKKWKKINKLWQKIFHSRPSRA